MLEGKRVGSVVTLCAFVSLLVVPPFASAQVVVSVPVGTIVTCAFDAAISPTAATVGQAVVLRVVDDVVVDGTTVITAGAAVRGEVVLSQTKGSVGKPAKIHVTVRSVQAVDGTSIALTGTTSVEGEDKQTTSLVITILCCVLGLLQKGGDAEIPAGTTLTASTLASATVTVPE